MDPLAMVSLVGNVVQFIDLSSKLLAEAKSIYKSGNRNVNSVDSLDRNMVTLQALAARASTRAGEATAIPVTADEITLEMLAGKAKTLAQDVTRISNKIRLKNANSKIDVMRVVLKAHRMDGKFNQLEQRASECRTEILELWTMMTGDKQLSTLNSLKKALDDMVKDNKAVLHAVNSAKNDLDEAVIAARQQTSNTENTLIAIKSGIDKILETTKQVESIDLIMKRLRFDEIHTRELSIVDPHQHTFRWLLYERDQRLDGPFPDLSQDDENLSANEVRDHNVSTKTLRMRWRKAQNIEELRAQESVQEKMRNSFLYWLQSGKGIFYISGKPGSGKSTLMKFICSEAKTRKVLEQWATDKKLLFARFFFWAAGSEKQRSVEGLYRAMLWEVLRECPSIAHEIFPESGKLLEPTIGDRFQEDGYTLEQLRSAFKRLITDDKIAIRHKICMFIDGIDEYGGEHWGIAKELIAWSQNSHVKICVSARPHNEFEQNFGLDPAQKLVLDQMTRSDMISLLRDELLNDERFDALKDQYHYGDLEEALITKAEGVFIWLKFALQDLLVGIGNAYSVPQLLMRLETIPPEVEDIYARLLDSIPKSDKVMAAKTFITILDGKRVFRDYDRSWLLEDRIWRSDIIFSFLDDILDSDTHDLDKNCKEKWGILNAEELDRRQATIKKRVNARCKGLLHFTGDGWLESSQCIEPVHRTVFDYLTRTDVRARLEKDAPRFDISVPLVMSHIRLLQTGYLGARYFPQNAGSDASRFAYFLESVSESIRYLINLVEDPLTFLELIKEFEHAVRVQSPHFNLECRTYGWIYSRIRGRARTRGLFLGHGAAFESSFTNFLVSGLSKEKLRLILSKPKYSSKETTMSWLLVASVPAHDRLNSINPPRGRIEVLNFLFRQNLNPNSDLPNGILCAPYLNNTNYRAHWTSWTASLFFCISFVRVEKPDAWLVELVKAYLSSGADPHIAIIGYLTEFNMAAWKSRDYTKRFNSNQADAFTAHLSASDYHYMDLMQLLHVWRISGVQSLEPFMHNLERPSATSRVMSMLPSLTSIVKKTTNGFKRLDTADLGTRSLLVLDVVSMAELSDVDVRELSLLHYCLTNHPFSIVCHI